MSAGQPARSDGDAETRPAVLHYHEPTTDYDAAASRRTAHVRLSAFAAMYLVLNVALVWLCFTGAIHPPWGVLGFFSFWAPLLLVVGIVFFQCTSRPFHWGAVFIFLSVIASAAFVNLMVLMEASASV